ncbi:MAG: hypothetical protein HQL20_05135 [Candidatus Omnitrophica bacterium]|nr:hypothetical protein [Candidatus Omnitrophota bacterium]
MNNFIRNFVLSVLAGWLVFSVVPALSAVGGAGMGDFDLSLLAQGVVRDITDVSIVSDGARMFIGLPAEDVSGAIVEYKSVKGRLKFAGKIHVHGLVANDRFGIAFAEKNGLLAAIALPANKGLAPKLYIFRRNARGVFVQEAVILLTARAPLVSQDLSTEFVRPPVMPVTAVRVALDGNTIVLGLPARNEVRIVRRQVDLSWKMDRIIALDVSRKGQQFGEAVAVAGNRLVVGAPGIRPKLTAKVSEPALNADVQPLTGSVYMYALDPTSPGSYAVEQVYTFAEPTWGTSVALVPAVGPEKPLPVGAAYKGADLWVGAYIGQAGLYQETLSQPTASSAVQSSWEPEPDAVVSFRPLPGNPATLKMQLAASNGRMVISSEDTLTANDPTRPLRWNIYSQNGAEWKLTCVSDLQGEPGKLFTDGNSLVIGRLPSGAHTRANSYQCWMPKMGNGQN